MDAVSYHNNFYNLTYGWLTSYSLLVNGHSAYKADSAVLNKMSALDGIDYPNFDSKVKILAGIQSTRYISINTRGECQFNNSSLCKQILACFE